MAEEKRTTKGKIKEIHLRVTEEEHSLIKEKSKKYPSMSALIIDAVKEYDVRKGSNRIDLLIEFSECVRSIEVEMARVGNNLNQITHAIHLYKYSGCDLPSMEALQSTLQDNLNFTTRVLREVRRIGNKNSKV